MIRPHRSRIVAVLAGATVALVALGGVATAGEVTKDQFVREADTICGETTTATYTIAVSAFGADGAPPTVAELTSFVERARPILEQEIKDLRALEKPRRDRKRVKRILTALEDDLAAFAADPASALIETPFQSYARLASAYGFQVCGTEAG